MPKPEKQTHHAWTPSKTYQVRFAPFVMEAIDTARVKDRWSRSQWMRYAVLDKLIEELNAAGETKMVKELEEYRDYGAFGG